MHVDMDGNSYNTSHPKLEALETGRLGVFLRSFGLPPNHSYGIVANEDVSDDVVNNSTSAGILAIVKGLWVRIIVVLVIMGVLGLGYASLRHETHFEKPKYCGSTPAEARLNGCQFEPMLSAWVPLECSFPELVQEYQDVYGDIYETWPWYHDSNLTIKVKPE